MNRGSRVEWNAARSYAIDAAEKNWVAKAVERRAELEAQGLIDANCRYAIWDIRHECQSSDGEALRPYATCWFEARAQILEAAQEERERAQAHEAEAVHPSGGGPEYRWTQR